MYNPLDHFFVIVSTFFPVDYVAMCCLVVYLVICTFEGISGLSLRLLWAELFSFKRRATEPTAVLLGVVTIASMILTVIVEVISVMPQYATFGAKQVNEVPCALGMQGCAMSEISKLVHRILAMKIFSFIFFYGTWVFVVVFIIAIFLAIGLRPRDDYVVPEGEGMDL